MKSIPYKVSIDIHKTTVLDASCECARGLVACHHIAAVLLRTNKNVSSTHTSCRWAVRNKHQKSERWVPVDALRLSNRKTDQSYVEPPTDEVLSVFIERLKKLPNKYAAPWLWYLSPECVEDVTDCVIPCPKAVICSEIFQNAPEKLNFLCNSLGLSWDNTMNIASHTAGQAANPLWISARKWRLTASKFGDVIAACERNYSKVRPSLLNELYSPPYLGRVKATMWGRDHESVAVESFSKATSKIVQKTGIWLHSCGFLGASPDGLIEEDSILEVKCLFKYRLDDLEEVLSKDQFYFACFSNKEWKLDTNHPYYHQIQGQLMLTRRSSCYFVMWTTKSLIYLLVPRDPDWEKYIPLLQNFYCDHFVPFVLQKEKERLLQEK